MHLLVDDVSVTFAAPAGGVLPALGPVSFEAETGSFTALLGPSGCGKSTLIRVIGAVLRADSGHVLADHIPVSVVRDRIGIMFQKASLMPWRTILDNIALPLELSGVSRSQRHTAVERLLPALGLEEFAAAYPSELSGGMAQRAALGRVLIQQPEILLLDEPFGALDALTRERISFDLLRIWSQQRQTALMVTHDIQEAILLADRVLVMSRRPGQIIADFTIDLPRPRNIEMSYTEEFAQKARQVRQAIDEAGAL